MSNPRKPSTETPSTPAPVGRDLLTETKSNQRSPKTRARISATLRNKPKSAEARAKMAESARRRWADKAERERLSATQRAVQGTPEMRARAAETAKKNWDDPVVRERHMASRNTEEHKAKASEAMKKVWADLRGDKGGDQ